MESATAERFITSDSVAGERPRWSARNFRLTFCPGARAAGVLVFFDALVFFILLMFFCLLTAVCSSPTSPGEGNDRRSKIEDRGSKISIGCIRRTLDLYATPCYTLWTTKAI